MGLKNELGAIEAEQVTAEYAGFYTPDGRRRPLEEQKQMFSRVQFSGEYVAFQALYNHIMEQAKERDLTEEQQQYLSYGATEALICLMRIAEAAEMPSLDQQPQP